MNKKNAIVWALMLVTMLALVACGNDQPQQGGT